MDGIAGKAPGGRTGHFLDIAGGLGLICLLGAIVVADQRAASAQRDRLARAGDGLNGEMGEVPPIDLDSLDSLAFGEKELPPAPQTPSEEAPKQAVYVEEKPDDYRYVQLGFYRPSYSFGLVTRPKAGSEKRLTFSNYGCSNHTAILVDGTQFVPGQPNTEVLEQYEMTGSGTAPSRDKNGAADQVQIRHLPENGPYRTVHGLQESGRDIVRFTQHYDYARGSASGLIDNVRVTYTLENSDPRRRPHTVAVRLMIDSLIGNRDGVPFYILGRKGGIIDRPKGFGEGYSEGIPDCILALEQDELDAKDNTFVQLLFDDQSAEKPSKLEVVKWPGRGRTNNLLELLVGANDSPEEKLRAAVANLPYNLPIRLGDTDFYGQDKVADSAIGLYYPQKDLAPGAKRTFSFLYGLGSLSSQNSKNSKLRLATYEKITAGKPFRLTAWVTNSATDTRVQLRLPKGMRAAPGEDTKAAERTGHLGKVDWLIETDDYLGGEFPIVGELVGTGITETIRVAVANPNPTVQVLDLTGEPLVGRRVRATVRVLNGRPGQRVAVKPPAGFALEPGFPDAVVLATGKETASWVFRLGAAAAGARTIEYTLDAAASASQAVAVRVPGPTILDPVADGNLASGGTFRVSVHTLFGRGGRTVELKLPDGLALKSGEAAKREVPAQPRGVVSWLVVADAGLRGPVQVGAQLDGEAARAARFEIVEPKPRLALRRPGTEGERVGRAFWLAADGVNLPEGARAVLKLPAGFGLVGGKPAEAAFERRDGFVRAAWLVSGSAAPAGGSAAFEVTAAGVSARLDVPVRRDSMMGQ